MSREAEQALLGAILLKPEIFRRTKVVENDFSDPRDRRIFKAMGELDADGRLPGDMALLAEALKDKETIIYLNSLADQVGTAASWEHYDQLVREASVKRQFGLLARRIGQQVKNGAAAAEILETSQEEIRRLNERLSGEKKTLHEEVTEWVLNTQGIFKTADCFRDLVITDRRGKKTVSMSLLRLEKENLIRKTGRIAGTYRRIDQDMRFLDFRNANPYNVLEVKWPFALQNYVKLLKKSIVILAGMWDAGKTAFLLNFVLENMHEHQILYMSSEMGEDELRLRLDMFMDVPLDYWKFDAVECASNWEDLIRPDDINIIDYLEIHKDHYEVGDIIRRVFDKLHTGLAIIALQKPPGRLMGKGGDVTAEKARLYLSLDPGELTITKGKLWADPTFNPKNLTFKFKLVGGAKFVQVGEPYRREPKK